jgi:Putative Actinobacterial Holin-X, holin superfamily III
MYAAGPGRAKEPRVTDWTTEATDVIERTVGLVRDRTVEPARAITKGVVYGLLAALIAIPAVILLLIGGFRGLVLLTQDRVWAAWLILGGIFVIAGAFCWTKRNP